MQIQEEEEETETREWKKIPPLKIFDIEQNPAVLSKQTEKICKNPVPMKFTPEASIFYPKSKEDYLSLKTNLKNYQHYSFTPEWEKHEIIVMKGLPQMKPEEIAKELTELGYTPIDILPIKKKNDPMPDFPVWIVKYITWEKYRCHRCQRFGHGSKNCNMDPVCVKCAKQHLTTDCQNKAGVDEPTCANCGDKHVASFSRCPKMIQYKMRNTKQAKPTHAPPTT